MNTTWVVVAGRSGARLFQNYPPGQKVRLIEKIDHPAGHLKDHDIYTDRPGRSFDSNGQGRHGMQRTETATEHEAARFAKDLGEMLNKGRVDNTFNNLILVAEPGFLGMLRGALDSKSARLVSKTLDKNLTQTPARDMPKALAKVL